MSTVNMVTEISEEKTPIIYTPFIFGNQMYIVSQQNTRRIENVASFSFGLLTPFGEVIQIDPSQHSVLFNFFISQLTQQTGHRNFSPLPAINPPVNCNCATQSSQTQFTDQSRGNTSINEKMDTSPCYFTCTKSTSTTELGSQNVGGSSKYTCRHCGNKKYILLDIGKSYLNKDEIEVKCEDCLKLNAREQLKLRKLRRNDSFV